MSPAVARFRYERELDRGIDHPAVRAKIGRFAFHIGADAPNVLAPIERVGWLRSAIPGFNNRHRRKSCSRSRS